MSSREIVVGKYISRRSTKSKIVELIGEKINGRKSVQKVSRKNVQIQLSDGVYFCEVCNSSNVFTEYINECEEVIYRCNLCGAEYKVSM